MISNSDFVNFNAAIKSNGFTDKNSSKREFPDFAQITNNRIYNETARNSSVPVTPIDVVGGDKSPRLNLCDFYSMFCPNPTKCVQVSASQRSKNIPYTVKHLHD